MDIAHELGIAAAVARLSTIEEVTANWNGAECRFSVGLFDPPVTGKLIVTDTNVEIMFDKEDLSPKISGMIGFRVRGALMASLDDE